jgi:hypothetical protein
LTCIVNPGGHRVTCGSGHLSQTIRVGRMCSAGCKESAAEWKRVDHCLCNYPVAQLRRKQKNNADTLIVFLLTGGGSAAPDVSSVDFCFHMYANFLISVAACTSDPVRMDGRCHIHRPFLHLNRLGRLSIKRLPRFKRTTSKPTSHRHGRPDVIDPCRL